MAPDAVDNLLEKMKAEITKLLSFPQYALIDEEPWRTEGIAAQLLVFAKKI